VKAREMSWSEIAAHLGGQDPPAVLVPLGAVEAHGPHLPLDTDTVIAERLAEVVADELLRWHGVRALLAHSIPLSVAGWAADFPGTVSLEAHTEEETLRAALRGLRSAGARRIALVNVHFDPGHLAAVKAVMADMPRSEVVFTDFTRKANAQHIGGEFARGACHGGQFETSLVLAVRPGAVRPLHRDLPPIDLDLASAIRSGKTSFREVGLDQAYCGDPASATAAEGERLYAVLASLIVAEAVAAWGTPARPA
jgi:creatinine amidohydrolase